MDREGNVEDIFEDGLLTIFGDVNVSHGEPGEIFQYRTPTGYLNQTSEKAHRLTDQTALFLSP